jgi:hypothetical protein
MTTRGSIFGIFCEDSTSRTSIAPPTGWGRGLGSVSGFREIADTNEPAFGAAKSWRANQGKPRRLRQYRRSEGNDFDRAGLERVGHRKLGGTSALLAYGPTVRSEARRNSRLRRCRKGSEDGGYGRGPKAQSPSQAFVNMNEQRNAVPLLCLNDSVARPWPAVTGVHAFP